MKVFKNGRVYVQKEDLMLLLECGRLIPASVFDKVYSNEYFVVGESNKEDYIEFNKPEDLEFFESLDWIVDYDEVKDLSLEEIDEIFKKTQKEMEQILKSSFSNKKDYSIKPHIKYELLNNRLYTLAKVYYYKSHKVSLILPNENGFTKLIRKLKTKR